MSSSQGDLIRNAGILPSVELLVFDLDGVITSEQIYLETARCTIQEIVESDEYFGAHDYFSSDMSADRHFQRVEEVVSPPLVTALKTRAVNSNWDMCYLCACLHIVGILSEIRDTAGIDLLDKDASLERILLTVRCVTLPASVAAIKGKQTIQAFLSALHDDLNASPLYTIHPFIERRLGTRFTCLEPGNQLWTLCFEIFQQWIHGCRSSKYAHSMPPMEFKEKTVVDASRLAATLKHLRHRGYVLGIATGRPRREAIQPLEEVDILSYFDAERIVTYDDVLEAEGFLMKQGAYVKLGKPHPFVIRKAISPHAPFSELTSMHTPALFSGAIMIGDSTADVIAAKRAGSASIGVLTGLGWDDSSFETKRHLLMMSGCDVVVDDVLEVPSVLGFRG